MCHEKVNPRKFNPLVRSGAIRANDIAMSRYDEKGDIREPPLVTLEVNGGRQRFYGASARKPRTYKRIHFYELALVVA